MPEPDTSRPAVAIDLGTTFSVVAQINRDGRPETVVNEEGDLSTPSVVYFDDSCPVVGKEAINAAEFNPQRMAQFAKRDMGSELYSGSIAGRQFPPEVIQALVLKKLKADAELRIGPFDQAVLTVPAYFNEPRRKATQDAGKLAGIRVLDIINEPTAAAIAHGAAIGYLDAGGQARQPERVLVYDLGGGTFDVSVMDIRQGDFRTVATAGDAHLGGIDWDQRLQQSLAEQFQRQTSVDIIGDPAAEEKLRALATRAKKTLSARDEAVVRMHHGPAQAQLKISRQEFETLTCDLVERTRLTLNHLLKEAQLRWSDITRLLLVGGSTRMPMIAKMLEQESGMPVDRSLSPDEAVAHGAAVYAGILLRPEGFQGSGVSVTNVNSHDLGVLGVDRTTGKPRRQIMIPRNSSLPCTAQRRFVTSRDGQQDVVVSVVEGGTDSGVGATRIGKCKISGLPEKLPQGTPVEVTFEYGGDGRLTVSGEIPATDCRTHSTIERANGLTDEAMLDWKVRIDAGISLLDVAEPAATETDQVKGSAKLANPQPARSNPAKTSSASSVPAAGGPVAGGPLDGVSFSPVAGGARASESSLSGLQQFLNENQSRDLAQDTNVSLPVLGDGDKSAAGQSAIAALENPDSPDDEIDETALGDFFKNLEPGNRG